MFCCVLIDNEVMFCYKLKR